MVLPDDGREREREREGRTVSNKDRCPKIQTHNVSNIEGERERERERGQKLGSVEVSLSEDNINSSYIIYNSVPKDG